MSRTPPAAKSHAQRTFSALFYFYLTIGALAYFAWSYDFPYVAPSVSWMAKIFAPLTSLLIYRFLHFNNADLEVIVTLAALIFAAVLISTPFLPMLERRLIGARLRRGEREGIRIQNIRAKHKRDPGADNTAR
jgi:hypothetical protein